MIDRFRDRLVFPLHDDRGQVIGFTARRNPTHDQLADADERVGPKYLNTPATPLYTKGRHLFGHAEALPDLATGATPTLVEGPLDTIAVTLAGRGQYVGVGTLGTAFTDPQADHLRRYLRADRGIIVATDNDTAGRAAAERAYWQLTARGDNPSRLQLPAGMDPARLLQTYGPDGLYDALSTATPLARTLIDSRLAGWAGRLTGDDITGQHLAAHSCAQIIGALPPQYWLEHGVHLTHALATTNGGLVPDAILAAGTAWTDDPTGQARLRLSQRADWPAGPDAPTDRWAELARTIDVRIVPDPGWIALAAALDRAHATGYPVQDSLPRLAHQQPLDPRHPALDLHNRLASECDAAITMPDAETQRAYLDARAEQIAANARRTQHTQPTPAPQQTSQYSPPPNPQPTTTPTPGPGRGPRR